MRLVEDIYDARFAHEKSHMIRKEKQKMNRERLYGNLDATEDEGDFSFCNSFPVFVAQRLTTVIGLKALTDQTGWDLLCNIDRNYKDFLEIETFKFFLQEKFGDEDLLFFLYLRSIISKMLKMNFSGRWTLVHGPERQPKPIYVTYQECVQISFKVFGNSYGDLGKDFLTSLVTSRKLVGRVNKREDSRKIEVRDLLYLAVLGYHKTQTMHDQGILDEFAAAEALIKSKAERSKILANARSIDLEQRRSDSNNTYRPDGNGTPNGKAGADSASNIGQREQRGVGRQGSMGPPRRQSSLTNMDGDNGTQGGRTGRGTGTGSGIGIGSGPGSAGRNPRSSLYMGDSGDGNGANGAGANGRTGAKDNGKVKGKAKSGKLGTLTTTTGTGTDSGPGSRSSPGPGLRSSPGGGGGTGGGHSKDMLLQCGASSPTLIRSLALPLSPDMKKTSISTQTLTPRTLTILTKERANETEEQKEKREAQEEKANARAIINKINESLKIHPAVRAPIPSEQNERRTSWEHYNEAIGARERAQTPPPRQIQISNSPSLKTTRPFWRKPTEDPTPAAGGYTGPSASAGAGAGAGAGVCSSSSSSSGQSFSYDGNDSNKDELELNRLRARQRVTVQPKVQHVRLLCCSLISFVLRPDIYYYCCHHDFLPNIHILL